MILNYTTTIEPSRTVAEIQDILSRYNVNAMMTEMDCGQISALSFRLKVGEQVMSFRLPCNWRGVRQVFDEQGMNKVRHKDRNLDNQAIRTAWRIVKDWVEAQVALVDVNMVTLPQVFLPYTIMKDGRTLAETVSDDPKFLLS